MKIKNSLKPGRYNINCWDIKMPPAKYIITLGGIDIRKIIKNHYRTESSTNELDRNDDLLPEEEYETKLDNLYETNVTSLIHENSKKYVTFLDPHQSSVKMWITMLDYVTGGPLPVSTDKACWWCRDTFISCPIGAPIKYHSHKLSGPKKEIIENNLRKYNLPTDTNDFFETEGIFCSFPCVKAYISEELKKGNILYKDSTTLLSLLYFKLYGIVLVIDKAPTWRLIDKWGGHLPINHYRASYCKLEYTTTCNIKRPLMYSVGTLIEETRCM